MNDDRKLTDADVEAIVTKLRSQLITDFYGEIGKGLWASLKRAVLPILVILALYGMSQDKSFIHNLFTDH